MKGDPLTAPASMAASSAATATLPPKRLNPFERYLSLWVGLCMGAGVLLGKAEPGLMESLRRLEFGEGSQINVPIAVLIWLMITPMMIRWISARSGVLAAGPGDFSSPWS